MITLTTETPASRVDWMWIVSVKRVLCGAPDLLTSAHAPLTDETS